MQENSYYAFGMDMPGMGFVVGTSNQYLYNGKEKHEELFGQYDYGARFYDPVIGRFTTVDPSADEADQESWSPYGYVYSNPVKHIDPDGRIPILIPVIYVAAKVAVHAAAWATIYVGARAVHEKYKNSQQNTTSSSSSNGEGTRRKNRLPDTGEPNTTQTNKPGTTTKIYGPNGQVQKEYNKGHGKDAPKNEQKDHVHDHKPKPNSNNPNATERQPGRPPKPNELEKDKAKQNQRNN